MEWKAPRQEEVIELEGKFSKHLSCQDMSRMYASEKCREERVWFCSMEVVDCGVSPSRQSINATKGDQLSML